MTGAPTRARLSCAGIILVTIATATGCTTPEAQPPAAAAPSTTAAEVVAVVDGDTIDVATDAGTQRVRLIGIDTPEINREGGASECYADEARDYLDALLYGRHVELQADPTQSDVDKYGRLLRYVYIDGQSAALLAIEAGAGFEYTYDVPYVDQGEHLDAQVQASAEGVGIWAACVWEGK